MWIFKYRGYFHAASSSHAHILFQRERNQSYIRKYISQSTYLQMWKIRRREYSCGESKSFLALDTQSWSQIAVGP